MNPNTKRIREVADNILRYGDLYNQGTYGETFSDENLSYINDAYMQAGVGIHNCGTPACIAGFAVQLFGEPEEYRQVSPDTANTPMYARQLLGLDIDWTRYLFYYWPAHWFNKDSEELSPSMTSADEPPTIMPDARQAHQILYRLADQFDNKTRQENE